jgi:large subunit ribosomal protein L24
MSQSGRIKLTNILQNQTISKRFVKPSARHKPRRWNILTGDTVQVVQRSHPEYGKQGTIMAVIRDEMEVIVENLNMKEREIDADPERGIAGRTVMVENPIHYSNVNLVDPVTGFPTKVTYSFLEDGTKVRISKRSGAIIPKPDFKKPVRNLIASEDSDTMNDGDVWGVTFENRVSKWVDLRNELLKTLEENGLDPKV